MVCFCEQAVMPLNRFVSPAFGIALPPIPPTLQLAVALPGLDEAQRLDMRLEAEIASFAMPNITMPSGGLMNLAMTLTMLSGSFTFDDLPMLEFQMEQAAQSLQRNVWPAIGHFTGLPLIPLLNYAIVARLVLDLTAMGIDPFVIDMPPPAPSYLPTFKYSLPTPQLAMARFFAGLPRLLDLPLALDLPPLGDPGAGSALTNRLEPMSNLVPPNLVLPIPQLMRLATVLPALMTIEEAFGADAMTPSKMQWVRAMLTRWSTFPIPIPYPMQALALTQKLDALPAIEDVHLGMDMASAMSPDAWTNMLITPPKLLIAPFLNMVLALSASLQLDLGMEPFDMCSLCPCA